MEFDNIFIDEMRRDDLDLIIDEVDVIIDELETIGCDVRSLNSTALSAVYKNINKIDCDIDDVLMFAERVKKGLYKLKFGKIKELEEEE